MCPDPVCTKVHSATICVDKKKFYFGEEGIREEARGSALVRGFREDFDRGLYLKPSFNPILAYLSAMVSVINDFANQPFVIAPRRCIIKGTVTISVRNEQFQIAARGTERDRDRDREREKENRRLSQAPISSESAHKAGRCRRINFV